MDYRPTYASQFSCIGPACEDHCCNLEIALSKEEYMRMRTSKSQRVRVLASQFVSVTSIQASSEAFAKLTRRPAGECGFLSAQHTCTIQDECGETQLPRPCFIYPRVLNRVEGEIEGSLHLSCPEAARQVLLGGKGLQSPASFQLAKYDGPDTVELTDRWPEAPQMPYHAFKAIRRCVLEHLRNRAVPVWERLFAIGVLCEELDRVPTDHVGTLQFFDHYKHRIDQQMASFSNSNSRDGGPATRLSVFLGLTVSTVQDPGCHHRLQEMFWHFVEGIGTTYVQDPHSDVSRFAWNAEHYYLPLMSQNPALLENYLMNYVFQNLFPFGRADTLRLPFSSFINEFSNMALQFAWLETLLVGVSGAYGEAFTTRHVVEVAQSLCRVVEHNPTAQDRLLRTADEAGLIGVAGIARLLML